MEEKPTELPVGVAEGINDDGREEPETRGGLTEVVAIEVPVEVVAAAVLSATVLSAEVTPSAVWVALALSDVVVSLSDAVVALADVVVSLADAVVEDASTGVASNPHAVAALDTEVP